MNAGLYQEPCSSFPDSFGSDVQTSISREEAKRGRSRVATRFSLPSQWQNRQVRLLRFLALERLARGFLILALGVEGLRLTGDPSASLRQWNLVVKQLARINSNFADAILHSSIYEGFIKLLHVQTSTWLVIFSGLLLYGLLICIEGVIRKTGHPECRFKDRGNGPFLGVHGGYQQGSTLEPCGHY